MAIIISTHKNVATVQVKFGKDYAAESSEWKKGFERFPLKAVYRAVKRVIKMKLRRNIPMWKARIASYLINL